MVGIEDKTTAELKWEIGELKKEIQNLKMVIVNKDDLIRILNNKVISLKKAHTSRFKVSKAWLDKDLEGLEGE